MSNYQDETGGLPPLNISEPPPLDPSAVWAGPADVGGAMTGAWRMLMGRRELLATAGVCIAVSILASLWQTLTMNLQPKSASESFANSLSLPTIIGMLIVLPATMTATYLASELTHQRREFRLDDFLAKVARRTPLLLLSGILLALGCVPGVAMCFVPGIVLYTFLAFMTMRAAIEGDNPIAAWKASWSMTNGLRMQIFLLLLINGIAVGIFTAPMSIYMMFTMQPGQTTTPPTLPFFLMTTVVGVFSAVISSYFSIAISWFYLERRAGRI